MGELAKPFTRQPCFAAFSVLTSRAEAQRLASLLRDEATPSYDKVLAWTAAAAEAEWFGNRLANVSSEEEAEKEAQALTSELESGLLGYRGEAAPTALLTWIQVLEVTGPVATLAGTSPAQLEGWLKELQPSELTRLVSAQVVVSAPLDRARVERIFGSVLQVDRPTR